MPYNKSHIAGSCRSDNPAAVLVEAAVKTIWFFKVRGIDTLQLTFMQETIKESFLKNPRIRGPRCKSVVIVTGLLVRMKLTCCLIKAA